MVEQYVREDEDIFRKKSRLGGKTVDKRVSRSLFTFEYSEKTDIKILMAKEGSWNQVADPLLEGGSTVMTHS